MFAARANKKTAAVIASFPKKIESGKELKAIQGIGKGSQDKVSGHAPEARLLLNAAALLLLTPEVLLLLSAAASHKMHYSCP